MLCVCAYVHCVCCVCAYVHACVCCVCAYVHVCVVCVCTCIFVCVERTLVKRLLCWKITMLDALLLYAVCSYIYIHSVIIVSPPPSPPLLYSEFCVCMVTVQSRNGPIRNSVLPNHMSDLANFIGLESR